MPRLVVVVLLLSLTVAPAVSAEQASRGKSLSYGWLDAFWDVLDRVFSWIPTVGSVPRKHGAYIDSSGVSSPSPGWAQVQSVPRKSSGAYIDPSGIRVVLSGRGNPGLREGVPVRRND